MHHGPVTPQIAKGLLKLRERIAAAKIPPSKLDETINVAVWNIREFGRRKRTSAALHYIAEIVGQFDLVALVELRDNLAELECVMDYLGRYWDIVYSDWTDDAGGNGERTAFLFDRRAVIFNGLAAEIDPPRSKSGTEYLASQSFWRQPYMCSFRAGNFDFIAIASHTRWGSSLAGREAELKLLADWIGKRFAHRYVEDHDLIVMGDFNIPAIDDALFKALTTTSKLTIPSKLRTLSAGERMIKGSNLNQDMRYDQILHRHTAPENFISAAGALDFFIDDSRIRELFPEGMTREKFSYQLSDHLPLWVQMKVDIDGFRLTQIVKNARK